MRGGAKDQSKASALGNTEAADGPQSAMALDRGNTKHRAMTQAPGRLFPHISAKPPHRSTRDQLPTGESEIEAGRRTGECTNRAACTGAASEDRIADTLLVMVHICQEAQWRTQRRTSRQQAKLCHTETSRKTNPPAGCQTSRQPILMHDGVQDSVLRGVCTLGMRHMDPESCVILATAQQSPQHSITIHRCSGNKASAVPILHHHTGWMFIRDEGGNTLFLVRCCDSVPLPD